MKYQDIVVGRDEDVGIIRLNRPKVLNALSRDLTREVDTAIEEFEADAQIKAIIFTGTGERAFSAGADIHEQVRDAENPLPLDSPRDEYRWHLASCAKPTIGAINGLAYGGAAVMSTSFDIRVGCERTSFKFLAASYGRVNSTWTLPMQVGWPMAKELLFTARVVEAEEAYRIGLLNHLATSNQLKDKALKIGRQIAANDPWNVQGIKELLIKDVGVPWKQMLANEREAQKGKLKATPVLEGFKPFLDRKGRR